MLIQSRAPDGKYQTRHGLTRSPLMVMWTSMIKRCSNPKSKSWHRYGGRGITVCPEWYDFSVFAAWALANGYAVGLQIDRIDNDSGYRPDNVRFVTRYVQQRNTSRSRRMTAFGETKTIAEWADDPRCQVPHFILRQRVVRDGIAPEKALALKCRRNLRQATIFGQTQPIVLWVRDPRCQVNSEVLHDRLSRGWPPEDALTKPIGTWLTST